MITGTAHGEATIHKDFKRVCEALGGCPEVKIGIKWPQRRQRINSRLQLVINSGKYMLGYQLTEDNRTGHNQLSSMTTAQLCRNVKSNKTPCWVKLVSIAAVATALRKCHRVSMHAGFHQPR